MSSARHVICSMLDSMVKKLYTINGALGNRLAVSFSLRITYGEEDDYEDFSCRRG